MKAEDLSENTEANGNHLQIIAFGRGTVEMYSILQHVDFQTYRGHKVL